MPIRNPTNVQAAATVRQMYKVELTRIIVSRIPRIQGPKKPKAIMLRPAG